MAMELDEWLVTTAGEEMGEVTLWHLCDSDPTLFLSPSANHVAAAREASQHIYSLRAPFSPAQPPPLSNLLTGPAFNTEKIWSQVELLTRPLLPHLPTCAASSATSSSNPPSQQQAAPCVETPADTKEEQSEEDEGDMELEELNEEEDEELEGTDDEDEEELEAKGGNGVEDKFLKTKHLEEFLEQAEEEEYGGGAKRGKKKATKNWMMEDSDDDEGMVHG